MKLPQAPEGYDPADQAHIRSMLERADGQNLKAGSDVRMRAGRIVLYSPNGTAYALSVNNAGTLSTATYP